MEKVLIVAMFLMPAAISVAGALYLAVHGKDGWGWFLFVAVLLGAVKITGLK